MPKTTVTSMPLDLRMQLSPVRMTILVFANRASSAVVSSVKRKLTHASLSHVVKTPSVSAKISLALKQLRVYVKLDLSVMGSFAEDLAFVTMFSATCMQNVSFKTLHQCAFATMDSLVMERPVRREIRATTLIVTIMQLVDRLVVSLLVPVMPDTMVLAKCVMK